MFKVGDKVRTLSVVSRTDLANSLYSGRNATITEISYPIGIAVCYRIKYDEPFYYCGDKIETHYYYDYEDGLELRNSI